ncbi:serine/threonine-protein kinase hal4 [Sodiomyces alkalinus F11]|uniref:Serine/threonine-protein kinase hal4 n=1 Tax=Sodiomyces alkalinus (strain CBS 110278 / VKM F-3762 / F11) TaxID=1314773 RepID=A0A3N2Q4Q6_SODAK|nr:serine/threonine-protein kinase hal4 [Sodiomyces alkalinus F11]ROT41686.1 serine/threonine-protein kinase hal4 [Sodiomyces alkalinus F11]
MINAGDDLTPNREDFKNTRASTGFSLRSRVIGFGQTNSPSRDKNGRSIFRLGHRSNLDREDPPSEFQLALGGTREPPHHHHRHRIEPSPWVQMPDAGVGVKSRRLSVSLPDDFFVEVADLLSVYEYQNKFFGRHGRHLGKGATSKVTLMARKGFPGELYAVKEFRRKSKAETVDEYEKKVKSEYSIAKSLHHPNIVETVQLCTDHGRWNHVMEYCSDGDLYQLVEKGYLKDCARLPDRLCLFKQVARGVNYLHRNGIAHRDIKLENCLISAGSKLKITDFGVSEVFCGTHPGLREAGGQCGTNMNNEIRLCAPGICGSEPYIAPEVLRKDRPYDPRGMDVWGTAILMIYLTFGANIWKRAELKTGSPNYDLLVTQWEKWYARHSEPDPRITELDYPHYVPFDQCVTPPALRRVLLMMLNPDPAKRASIADVVNNRWVKNIECCRFDSYDEPAVVIDASKKDATRVNGQKIFCHNHMPVQSQGHSLGKMPGQPGY